MSNLAEFFTADHRSCDAQWAKVEEALNGKSPDAAALWKAFDGAMRRHLGMEEEIMFPAFEQASGMTGGGPTFVMRAEHEQMRALLAQIDDAIEAGDTEEALDQGDTLLMLIQQHNMKEERMLYPMAQGQLAAEWGSLEGRLKEYAVE